MRARNIKPGFYKNEDLGECSFAARLLFPGLWMMADKEGRLEYRPKRIKAEIFPYDNLNIEELVDELEKAGMIKRYVAGNGRFLWIPGFARNQTLSKQERETESKLPAYQGNIDTAQYSTDTVSIPKQNVVLIPNQDSTDTVSISLNTEVLNTESSSSVPGEKTPATPEAENLEPETRNRATARRACELWNEILAPLGFSLVKKPTPGREKHFSARLAEEPERAEMSWWRELFLRVSSSGWLVSEAQRHANWLTFDWLLNENNLVKVLEGKYDATRGDDADNGPFDLSGVPFFNDREPDGDSRSDYRSVDIGEPEEPPPEPPEDFEFDVGGDDCGYFPGEERMVNYAGSG